VKSDIGVKVYMICDCTYSAVLHVLLSVLMLVVVMSNPNNGIIDRGAMQC
jgi:hypothetical protein